MMHSARILRHVCCGPEESPNLQFNFWKYPAVHHVLWETPFSDRPARVIHMDCVQPAAAFIPQPAAGSVAVASRRSGSGTELIAARRSNHGLRIKILGEFRFDGLDSR